MPPRRRPANEITVEEAYALDRMMRLEQQVEMLMQQFQAFIANQNHQNHNAHDAGDDFEESDDSQGAPRRRRRVPDPPIKDRRRWEAGMHTEVPVFHGSLQPQEFLDWICTAEKVLDFKGVPENMRVPLVATRLRGRAAAWWQQFKLSRTKLGKSKIATWEKLKKHMRSTFLPYNFQRTLYQHLQNLR
ncbi:hypothetical protein MRB53_021468 [Persea americana]|uniref:Uncharacterized protein n=1 Tax=Persea americana TaxID=3435 RepID=A0ACC2L4Q2_PERAE|nr:hypothetical protein MRB53_021468 [Persea americana]